MVTVNNINHPSKEQTVNNIKRQATIKAIKKLITECSAETLLGQGARDALQNLLHPLTCECPLCKGEDNAGIPRT